MKNLIAIILILAAIAAAYTVGRENGIWHAIEDSVIWTVDRYDPDDPEASAWGGYDQLIFIELDGDVYEHGMIQC